MTARIIKCNTAEYLSDPCAQPSLSASIAHTLVSQSALHAWSQHPKLGGQPPDPTRWTDSGSIIHKLILGAGADIAICGPFQTKAGKESNNWLSEEARRERAACIEKGVIPVLQSEWDEHEAIAARIRERLDSLEIDFEDGEVECAIEWTEEADDGTPVLCRGQLDFVNLAEGRIDDLKTTKVSVHPRLLPKWAESYGWPIKNAAYMSAVEHLKPELTGKVTMRFVCCETIPPYDIVAKPLDATFAMIGRVLWRRAVNEWAKCLRTNEWPGYGNDGRPIEAPLWLMRQYEESIYTEPVAVMTGDDDPEFNQEDWNEF